MRQEIEAYQKYLLNFGVVEKPKMPKFDESAYTDNEYLSLILSLMKDFDVLDSEYLTIEHLKGD